MSSVRYSIGRKRHHDSNLRDSSSSSSNSSVDSAEVFRSPKKKRETRFPSYITARVNNIRLWISNLHVSPFFDMALRSSAELLESKPDDDDDDVQVIGVKTADKLLHKDRPNPFAERLRGNPRRYAEISENCFYNYISKINGSNTDCILPSSKTSVSSRSKKRMDLNEISCHDWDPEIAVVHPINKPPDSKPRPTTCISSPNTDVEILLESYSKKAESDEIEILSESPPQRSALSRPVRIAARRSIKSSTPHKSATVARSNSVTQANTRGSYTCDEVVRLREKAQYQLLLQKFVSGSHYYPTVNRSQKDAVAQIDLTSDEFESSFKNQTHQPPVQNFLQKYLKPCQFTPLPMSSKQPSEKTESKEAKSDDDEIQILEVKLPKYRQKYKEKPNILSSEWINDLKSIVSSQIQERIKIVEAQEQEVENFRTKRTLERLKVIVPEPIEDEYPDLTPEMDEIVDKALTTGDPNDRLCKITSDYLLRKDIETLAALNWINDLVINSYFDLIVERSKQEGYPSVHAYNTFFYTTYKQKGYSSVRRWTRKLDIFSYDLNFVPLHLGVHWCLAVIDHRSKKICYYDSMGSGEEHCLDLLHEYLCLEYKDKKGKILDPNLYSTEVKKNIPQQMNGSDCGMFTLKYAEYISRDAVITFSQKHMHYFRRRMVYELITTQLL